MAITSSQAVRITKVKIPDRKSFARPLSEFYAALAREWRSPFLLVGGIRNGGKVWLTYENNYYAGSDYEIETFDFDLKDLDLYTKDAETANPTSHPMSVDEIAAYMQEQNDQDRRDYYMAEGKEKILQDALNKMCSWSKNDTFKHEKPVLAPLSNGINIVAEAEYPVFSGPMKPSHYNDTAITALMVIDNWQANFRIGNALKYLARYQKKGTPIQDLEKAAEYIALEIERLQAA